jgi:hypothetical protein
MSVIERIDGSPGLTASDAPDRDVEIERDLPIVIVPHQALDPEIAARRIPRVNGCTWCRLDAG